MRNNLNLYSLKERIYLVKTFYKSDCNVSSVKGDFILEFGRFDDIPPDSLIFDIIDLFEETGSVREVPNPTDHDIKVEILETSLLDVKLEEPEPKENSSVPVDIIPQLKEEKPQENKRKRRKPQLKEKDDPGFEPVGQEIKVFPEKTFKSKIPEMTKRKKAKREISKDERSKSKFNCAICGKKLSTKHGVRLHITHFHTKKVGLTCEFCNKSMETKHQLNMHLDLVHKNSPEREKPLVQCPQCPKTYTQRSLLNKHMKTHSDVKTEICDVCGGSFKNRRTLKQHMQIHTGVKRYKCNYPDCSRAYNNVGSLAIHKRTHTGDKPFPCEYCGKGFSDKTTLKVHYRQHTGENPYTCELCGKTTKQMQNLKSHMRHCHKIDKPK
ncbi:hypothetical protein DMENIID0001_041560 [Sergentomyia squamirostris]